MVKSMVKPEFFSPVKVLCNSDHHFQHFFTFKPHTASLLQPTEREAFQQRRGVSGRPECQPDASIHR